jgi:hypothetical protein
MLVDTIHGPMDDSLLQKKVVPEKKECGTFTATEYWLDGVLVHRSVHLDVDPEYLARAMSAGAAVSL